MSHKGRIELEDANASGAGGNPSREAVLAWHEAKAKDYDAWILPSVLMMTVSFGLAFLGPQDPPDDNLLSQLTNGTYVGSREGRL